MKTGNLIASLSLLAVIATLSACSSNSSSTTTTPPGGISVSISGAPASLTVTQAVQLTATVLNDATNSGVNWSLTCSTSGAACGALSAQTTSSASYTAPASVPVGNVVVVKATSIADNVQFATATIQITAAAGISVSLTTPPPASLATGASASVAATVSGDSVGAGVNWSCAPAGSCGTFGTPNPIPSGTAVTYTAPSAAVNVTITATSVTDLTKSASAAISITTSVAPTLPAGNYVFSLTGTDTNGFSPYFYAGAFTVASSGGLTVISGGEQDFSDLNYLATAEAITGGTITSTADGNLLLTLNFSDSYINNGLGTVTFDASLVSTTKGLLIEYDSFGSASGEVDLQATSLPTPSGGYAFFTSGLAEAPGTTTVYPFSWGGVINVDGATSISGTGSIFDMNNGATGLLYSDETFAASSVTSPDSFGLVTFTLNPSGVSTVPQVILDGYMVDANHIRLIEITDSLVGFTGGSAFGQGSNTGLFSSASVSGNSYVIGGSGFDLVGEDQMAGILTFNSDESLGGNISFNDLSSTNPPQGGATLQPESSPNCLSGTATTPCYTIDGPGVGNDGGTGRVTLTNVTDASTFSYNLQLFLTGDGHAVVISMDVADALAGLSWQQASTTFSSSALNGSYAADLTQFSSLFAEADGAGAFFADGVGTLNGFLDDNQSLVGGAPTPDTLFSSPFTTTSTNGVFDVTPPGGVFLTYYAIDNTQGVLIENDLNLLTLGYFDLQQ